MDDRRRNQLLLAAMLWSPFAAAAVAVASCAVLDLIERRIPGTVFGPPVFWTIAGGSGLAGVAASAMAGLRWRDERRSQALVVACVLLAPVFYVVGVGVFVTFVVFLHVLFGGRG
jgi:hypothetical protein